MVEIPTINIPDINASNFTKDFIQVGMQGYVNVFGVFFYPFVFSIIILCVFLYFRSAVFAVAIALVLFVCFGNAFMGVEAWVTAIHVIVSLSVSALLLLFLIKRRER